MIHQKASKKVLLKESTKSPPYFRPNITKPSSHSFQSYVIYALHLNLAALNPIDTFRTFLLVL